MLIDQMHFEQFLTVYFLNLETSQPASHLFPFYRERDPKSLQFTRVLSKGVPNRLKRTKIRVAQHTEIN